MINEARLTDLKQRAEALGNEGISLYFDAADDLRVFWGCEKIILDDLEKHIALIEDDRKENENA